LTSGVLAMDLREKMHVFFTDDFLRYSAECRRLARLAKPAAGKPSLLSRWSADLNSRSWIALMRPAVAGSAHRPALATVSRRR